ncbi:Der1-like family-domain-containing protein [Cladorrhinum samala]|uniref:Derlin n=1 Tax=Cladorrhinum samala TaxID=585594 RepID=A0AAV9HIX4_9PEZI|nr:Der1-like family-domain-containing protein [Cladorrhinum samala]
MSAELSAAFWQMPPIARTLSFSIGIVSVLAYTNILPTGWIYFHSYFLFKLPPQIWRLVTAYLLSGPQLGIIFDPYFVYQYASMLETASPKFPRKEDFLWYLMFVCTIIVLVSYNLFGSAFFLKGLILALCYTATQDQRGAKANFFFFTVPAQLVPYCMLLFSLVLDAGSLPLQLTGLFAAHLHDFLSRLWPEFGGGSNWLATPGWLSRLVDSPRVVQRQYGTAIHSNRQTAGSTTGASTGSVLPDSWKTRGSGHRLGGE